MRTAASALLGVLAIAMCGCPQDLQQTIDDTIGTIADEAERFIPTADGGGQSDLQPPPSNDPSGGLPPPPNTSPDPVRCVREWRNEEFDFGINPPPGADGPFSHENVIALFSGQWIGADGRRYIIQVLPGGLQGNVMFNRDAFLAVGSSIIQDRAWVSTSKQFGWLFEVQHATHRSVDVVLERNGIVFNAAVVDLTGASSTDLQVVTNFIDSLCADP